jgi:PAS domain S-box-containing protein
MEAEAALRASEARLRTLFEEALNPVMIVDDRGRYLDANRSALEFLESERKQLIGSVAWHFSPPGTDREPNGQSPLMGRGTIETDYFVQGRTKTLLLNVVPLTISDEMIVYCIGQDITKRREAEKALQESEQKYRSLVESTEDSIYLVDQDCTYLFMNNRHLAKLDLPIDDVIGKTYKECHFEQEIEEFTQKVSEVFKMGKSLWHEYKSPRDGRHFLRTLSPVKEPGGRVIAVTVVSKDITERRLAEEAVRESEKKYRRLFATVPDAVMISDVETGDFIDVNDSALLLYGYSKRDFLKLRFSDITAEQDKWQVLIDEVLAAKLTRGPLLFHKKKAGRAFPAEISASTFGLMGRKVICCLVRDVTERVNAEDELKKSREQLRDLSTYLQSAREQERTSIAREVHDDLGQTLTALKMDLSWLNKKLPKGQDALVEKTNAMTDLIDSSIQSVQRISSELRPGLLDDLGLTAAIEWQSEEFENRSGIICEVNFDPEDIVLDKNLATTIFRIFQETLTNVARHANASQVRVDLIQLSDPKAFGLIGMRERAFVWGGEVHIASVPKGGTTVEVSIPMAARGGQEAPQEKE